MVLAVEELPWEEGILEVFHEHFVMAGMSAGEVGETRKKTAWPGELWQRTDMPSIKFTS